jgi:isoleucyl-tRNA synthetase
VLDVWFDSGAMPYAQWHWPHENEEAFRDHFPADFICEGLDQTRGWFYSLMAISTMLGMGPAFRNVIVNGLILDADGQKMSKSKGNTVDPWDAIGEFGADPLRWYLVTVSNPWVAKRYDPEGVREAARKFFDTLFNTYRFFAMYARVEGWTPSEADPTPGERGVLDRWLLSRLNRLRGGGGGGAGRLPAHPGLPGGDRLPERGPLELVRAPVPGPLLGERGRRRRPGGLPHPLGGPRGGGAPHGAGGALHVGLAPPGWSGGDAVHLAPFPVVAPRDRAWMDDGAGGRWKRCGPWCRWGVPPGRRSGSGFASPSGCSTPWCPGRRPRGEVLEVLRDELNVKEVRFLDSAEGLVTLSARPNFRVLGPRFQGASQEAAAALRALDPEVLSAFRRGEEVTIRVGGEGVVVEPDWLEVVESAAGDLVVKTEEGWWRLSTRPG